VRKLHVNVQVTAITTFLEMCGCVTFIIHLAITKGPSLSTITHAMMVKLIIIPYAFLMNSSHNKERIIESGWKNVFKNIFMNSKIAKTEIECSAKQTSEPLNNATVQNKQNDLDKEIFMTTSSKNEACSTIVNDANDGAMVHAAADGDPEIERGETSTNSINSNGKLLDVNDLDYRHLMTEKLLSELVQCFENEEQYIKCFKQFLTFVNSSKKGVTLSEIELEDEFPASFIPTKKLRNKMGKGKRKYLTHAPSYTYLQKDSSNHDDKQCVENSIPNPSLSGDIDNRMRQRSEILNVLYSEFKENKKYDSLFDKLVDLEETFVKERL
jgi:hypothetical protein